MGVWGGDTHGHTGPTQSGSKTSEGTCLETSEVTVSGIGLEGTLQNLSPRAKGEGGALSCIAHEVHCHVA